MCMTQLERWKYEREEEVWEKESETDDSDILDDYVDRYGTIEDISYNELMDED